MGKAGKLLHEPHLRLQLISWRAFQYDPVLQHGYTGQTSHAFQQLAQRRCMLSSGGADDLAFNTAAWLLRSAHCHRQEPDDV